MKTTNISKSVSTISSGLFQTRLQIRSFVALLITLFIFNISNAQDVTVTSDPVTWGWLDAYPNNTVNGNLTITGGVPDLVELGDNSWQNLSTVTGNLIIKDANNLSSLNGLQFLTTVGGDVIIDNCNVLTDLLPLNNLISIGGELKIINNNAITSTGTLWNLQSVADVFINNNPILTEIDPFNNILTINDITVSNNLSLSAIASFQNTTSANDIRVNSNVALNNVQSFGSLTSLNSLEVNGNSLLADCCWATPLFPITTLVSFLNNATECESNAVVNAPPTFDICPPSTTVNTDINSCENSYPVRLPIAFDNCDILSVTVKITRGDGSIWFDGVYGSAGSTFNYPLNPGLNTFAFAATDMNGNSTECTSIITVVDNQPPVAPANFPDEFNIDAGINCMATFSSSSNQFTDNCEIVSYNSNISGGSSGPISADYAPGDNADFELQVGTYNYILKAVDVNGRETSVTAIINVLRTPETICPEDIPTMGQWALFILGLVLSSLAVVKIGRKSKVVG